MHAHEFPGIKGISLKPVYVETKQRQYPRCKKKQTERKEKKRKEQKENQNHIAFFSSSPTASSATHLASSLAKKSSLRMPERSHMPLKIPPWS